MKNNSREEFTKRLIKFSLVIIKFCNELRKDRNLVAVADQLIRSGTSIGANYTEAKSSSSKRDYLKYFEIALKSANESIYWLVLAKEAQPELWERADKILTETEEIAKVIGASILTMKGKRNIKS